MSKVTYIILGVYINVQNEKSLQLGFQCIDRLQKMFKIMSEGKLEASFLKIKIIQYLNLIHTLGIN